MSNVSSSVEKAWRKHGGGELTVVTAALCFAEFFRALETSAMENTLPDHLQGQRQLRHSSGSDMSDSSYQSYQLSEGFPGTRQSSINTEPLTLDAEEIGNAKVSAGTVGPICK